MVTEDQNAFSAREIPRTESAHGQAGVYIGRVRGMIKYTVLIYRCISYITYVYKYCLCGRLTPILIRWFKGTVPRQPSLL